MNFQPVIDNLHTILIGAGFLLWAVGRILEIRAKGNPATTWEDSWAPVAMRLASLGAEGIDILAELKKAKGDDSLASGQLKSLELQKKLVAWEEKWRQGDRLAVLVDAMGWYVDLQGKQAKLDPSMPARSSPPIIPSSRADTEEDPDPTTHLDDTPAS